MLTTGHDSGDFEKHFICGEIMAYEDLHEYGDEVAVRAVSPPLLSLLFLHGADCIA